METIVMNIKRSHSYFIILSFALVTGCASQQVEQTSTESKAMEPVAVNQNAGPGISDNETAKMTTNVQKPEFLKGEATVYFDSDSSALNRKAKHTLATNFQFLKEHPGMSVIIEGYADDRGTDSYNMMLGERRAQSIKQILLSENINANNIKLISYGETRPAMPGHSNVARSHNRRARLVYQENSEHVASN